MKSNQFENTPAPGKYPTLEKMADPLKALADLVHNHPDDSASRTVATTTLLLSLWQLAGRGMTNQAPSLVMINTHGEGSSSMDALASSLVSPQVDTGPQLYKDGSFAQGTPEMAPNAMAGAIRRYHEQRKHANLAWTPPELQMHEERFFAAQKTGFGYGRTRRYAKAWHDTFGLMTERDCQVILRLDSTEDLAMFRKHVADNPHCLQAALGFGPGLEMVSKRLCLSGAITPEQWDAEFAGRAVELGLPLLFLPDAAREPSTAVLPAAIQFMLTQLPEAFKGALEEPANLVPGVWFAHYGELLRTRLRMLSPTSDYALQRMARQLFPVSLRLTTCAGLWSGASAEECEALALDLCAHALRGMVISVAGLAWHGLGFDPGSDRKKALKVLDYLRRNSPVSLSDLTRYGKVEKAVRDTLLERFVAEGLVRVDGKIIVAVSYEEFAAGLYVRKEFPEPANHWGEAAEKSDAAA